MIEKIKKTFDSTDKKRLLSNFFSLFSLQIANYLFPLITFPYLVRVLGVEKYGLLAFAGATIAYFNILTDYGFNLTATREISIYRNSKEKIEEIFSSVMIIKTVLLVFSFLILICLILFFDRFRENYLVFVFSFGMVIGQVLFPQWFFQGMERMKYITILNVTAKAIFTVAIFVFVHKESDFIYVPLLNSFGFIIAGMLALWIVFKNFDVKFKLQKLEVLKKYFIESWHIFISRVFISAFTNTNTFLIGIFFNNTIVGYYAVAEKFVLIIKSFLEVINQTIYPFVHKTFVKDSDKVYKLLKTIMIIVIIFLLFLDFGLFYSSKEILSFLVKKVNLVILNTFYILLLIPVFVFVSMIIGQQILLSLKLYKLFTNSLVYMGILHLILFYPVYKLFGYYGVVWLVVFTEFGIMIYRIIGLYFYKKRRK